MVVGGENLSSAVGEECSEDSTSGTVRGFLPRKCLSMLPSIKTCRNAGVHRGPSRLLSAKILIYLPVLWKVSLSPCDSYTQNKFDLQQWLSHCIEHVEQQQIVTTIIRKTV